MRNRFQDILDCLVEKPPRSRLEPYSELISELRRRKRTYREIVRLLAEECDLRVSISTLHDFVRARSKEARRAEKLAQATAKGTIRANLGRTPASGHAPKLKEAGPRTDENRRKIAALKQRPASTPANPADTFEYDSDAPLRLLTGEDGGSG